MTSGRHFSEPCYVIAEAGVNHNGSVELAHRLVDVAADARCDAVKFQTFLADELVTRDAALADYQARNTAGSGVASQHEMLAALELSETDFANLRTHCADRGIDFLSTPFGPRAADLLERIGVDAFKVSSGDLTFHAFLAHLAAKGKPIILSTGMATLAEVDAALAAIRSAGDPQVSLLHCVSDYPADPLGCNLRAMHTLSAAFGCDVGWSDHTVGSEVSCAAVALGARIIEKHFTLDRTMEGPDHAASLEPDELVRFVTALRNVGAALGDGIKTPTAAECRTALVARRSVVATRAMTAGHILRAGDLHVMRPGTGLPPADAGRLVGLALAVDVSAQHPFAWSDFQHATKEPTK